MRPPAVAALLGWGTADHAGAWRAVRCSAQQIAGVAPTLRRGLHALLDVRRLREPAAAMPTRFERDEVRQVLEAWFTPRGVEPRDGLLTDYHEPVVDGAFARLSGVVAALVRHMVRSGILEPAAS